jgi:hypothetical protein
MYIAFFFFGCHLGGNFHLPHFTCHDFLPIPLLFGMELYLYDFRQY